MRYAAAFFAFLTAVRAPQPRATTITDSAIEGILSPRSDLPPQGLPNFPDPNDPGFVFDNSIQWDLTWENPPLPPAAPLPAPLGPLQPGPPAPGGPSTMGISVKVPTARLRRKLKHMPPPPDEIALYPYETVRYGVSKDMNLALDNK